MSDNQEKKTPTNSTPKVNSTTPTRSNNSNSSNSNSNSSNNSGNYRNNQRFSRSNSSDPGSGFRRPSGSGDRGNSSSGGSNFRRGGGRGGYNNRRNGDRKDRPFGKKRSYDRNNRRKNEEQDKLDNNVIQVRRITKVVKGGKHMRFSALVVVGDRQGIIGYGLAKGMDYQDAVTKATKKAKRNTIKINLNQDQSISFPINQKYKAGLIFLKPAKSGTGLIAGGVLRPVLELAGIRNVYSKIIGTNNKVVGIQTSLKALANYSQENNQKIQQKEKTKEKIAKI